MIQLFSRQEQRPEEYVLAMSIGDNIIQLGVSEPWQQESSPLCGIDAVGSSQITLPMSNLKRTLFDK